MQAQDTPRTVAEALGRKAADELARWAIDALVEPPADIVTHSTRIPASEVRAGRAILERAGIDWRKLKADTRSAERARRDDG